MSISGTIAQLHRAIPLVFLLAASLSTHAADTSAPLADWNATNAPPGWLERGYRVWTDAETRMDDRQLFVARQADVLAQWVDTFFLDPNYTAEEAYMWLRLRQEVVRTRHNSARFKTRLNARVHLPNASRRLLLVFDGNDDLEDNGDPTEDDIENAAETSIDEPAIGLRYFYDLSEKLNLSLNAKARISGGAVRLGPRLRFRTPIGERWVGRFSQYVRWNTDNEWDFQSRVDCDRRWDSRTLFRQTLKTQWREARDDEDGWLTTASSSFSQPLGPHRALRCVWSTVYASEPKGQWRSTRVGVSYRWNTWRDWAVFEVEPFAQWQEDDDWKTDPGLRVSVSILFREDPEAHAAH